MANSERFEKALILANRLHVNRNGSAMACIAHLLSVSGTVIEYGFDEDEAIAALLHQSLNDAVGVNGVLKTREIIRDQFGDKVLEMVDGFVDKDIFPVPGVIYPLPAEKDAFLTHLRNSTPSVRFILAADKLQNAACILKDYREQGEELWKHFKNGREGTLLYYRALIDEFGKGKESPIAEELNRIVSEIENNGRANLQSWTAR